jgi:NTP pyrophosphatase (non-canonical NTP hydrolase)
MPDTTTTLAVLRDAVRRFTAERDWEQFHSPKNLSMGLAVEAGELMEHFLWMEGEASRNVQLDSVRLGQVADEMADVAVYLLNLANALNIDLSDAIVAKIAKNALKYPAELYKGRYSTKENV